MSISIHNVHKSFGGFQALKDITLTIPTGELVALLGPSGSGKTSLLRIIAGLEVADQGSIHFDGIDYTNSHTQDRKVGFVFQHYALFRHMTVFENIAFGLRVRPKKIRPSKKEISAKVNELLQLVRMESLAYRYPSQLSGGQRQRVALARALAVEPKVLLLDEPFGALDAKVRKDLRRWLRRLHDEYPITSVFVTHDQEEALDVADRIVVMNEGGIEQIGTSEEVYEHPKNSFVYNFLGNVNLFRGRLNDGKVLLGNVEIDSPEYQNRNEEVVVGYVRPHNLKIERIINPDQRNSLKAKVHYIRPIGSIVHLELERLDSKEFIDAEITKEEYRGLNLIVGEEVYVKLNDLKVFPQEDFVI